MLDEDQHIDSRQVHLLLIPEVPAVARMQLEEGASIVDWKFAILLANAHTTHNLRGNQSAQARLDAAHCQLIDKTRPAHETSRSFKD